MSSAYACASSLTSEGGCQRYTVSPELCAVAVVPSAPRCTRTIVFRKITPFVCAASTHPPTARRTIRLSSARSTISMRYASRRISSPKENTEESETGRVVESFVLEMLPNCPETLQLFSCRSEEHTSELQSP